MSKMTKTLRVFEIVWLVITALSVLETIRLWNSEDQTQRYIFIGFVIVGILMYFFRRNMRIKMEKREMDKKPIE
jgi:tryptophan-rich sensory protein